MNTFDHIIVGGGTAGSVLAARLSEDERCRVLLLEAGPVDHRAMIADPTAWPRLARTSVDWDFTTVPQPGTDDAVHHWPRGRLLGGSSAINGMMHIRGDRASYDAWEAQGATGWSYESLLPYLMRSETTTGRDPRYRGTDGPQHVGPAPDRAWLWEACFEAAVQAGHPVAVDGNSPHGLGVAWNDMTVVDGARQSAADAYLNPVLSRPNLIITTDAQVQRLIITDGRCEGVEYAHDGRLETAFADVEVVLAAGTVGTPHLLLLSGVGPADQLRPLGIEVLADLAGVGANLHDHPMTEVSHRATRPVRPDRYARKPHVLLRTDPAGDPDIQMIFIEAPVHPRWRPGPEDGFSVICALMTPHSRGSIRLASADPRTAPLIDPRYLADERDVRRLVAGLRAARDVARAAALDEVRGDELYPGTGVDGDADLRSYLQRSVSTYFHPVGTCRIGTDPYAVVDPQLRVYGIDRLRVADASVMPSIVSGNTNAATLGIAERAAALLTASRVGSEEHLSFLAAP